jgi:hypothetical protein
MPKQMRSIRTSDVTNREINDLMKHWGLSFSEAVARCIQLVWIDEFNDVLPVFEPRPYETEDHRNKKAPA